MPVRERDWHFYFYSCPYPMFPDENGACARLEPAGSTYVSFAIAKQIYRRTQEAVGRDPAPYRRGLRFYDGNAPRCVDCNYFHIK